MFTILEKKKSFKGLKMAIIGDILYSRVARSNIAAWTKLGADVHVAGTGHAHALRNGKTGRHGP